MITKEKAMEILEKPVLMQGVKKYQYIMNRIYSTDVSIDAEFQKVFRDFYDMSTRFYSDDFAKNYFQIMENLKAEPNVSFKDIFGNVMKIKNTFEISYSSKMMHTFDDSNPIWDSVVTSKHFGIKAPTYPKNREQKMIEKYAYYKERFYEYLNGEEGQMLIALFDDKFPKNNISDVKKIDFIIWQDR